MNNSRIELTLVQRIIAGTVAIGFCAAASAADIHPRLLARSKDSGAADAILILTDQSPPQETSNDDYLAHRRALVDALRARADRSQAPLRAWLDERHIAHRDFWIVNAIQARLPATVLRELAQRTDVVRIDPNPIIARRLPPPTEEKALALDPAAGIGWGVAKINAPLVWAAGFTGQGVVIAGEDTGYQWDHPVLKPQYRGWNGSVADHNFNWHDAIHDAVGNPCDNDAQAPCDDDRHGTHTAGTFAGDDGAGANPRHQVGVAPGARWIGCRNMDRGNGTPARYIECMQWLLAPTDLAGDNANPDLAPDIISNSWSCPASEGCTLGTELQSAVHILVSAGILYVAAAQNAGPSCSTITDPPATYDDSFDVGATGKTDQLANFSSVGPVPGSALIRPDISAPGVNVCSSVPTNAYDCTFSGTSMATPHAAGAAALLMSAYPALKGHPEQVAAALRNTAVTQGVTDPFNLACGSVSNGTWPNFLVGYGRLDVYAAFLSLPIFADGFGD